MKRALRIRAVDVEKNSYPILVPDDENLFRATRGMDNWYNARSREFNNIDARMFIRHRVQPHTGLGKPRQCRIRVDRQ
jgi:hypothetical protein